MELNRKEISSEFIIGEKEFSSIFEFLQTHIGDVKIDILRLDDVSQDDFDLQGFFDIQNSKTTALGQTRISTHNEDRSRRIEVIFDRSTKYSTGAKLSITAPENEFENIRGNLVDIVVGTRPWYHQLYRLNFVVLSIAILFLLMLYSYLSVMLGWIELNESAEITISRRDELIVAAKTLALFGGIVGGGYVLNKIRDIVFPRAVFLIGQEKSRYSVIEKTQWGVVISFVVGSMISIWQIIV